MQEYMTREESDRRLFEHIAEAYASKDRVPSVEIARCHRARQTMAGIGHAGCLLEVGCGAGYAPVYLEGSFDSYVGIDYSENLIKYAQRFNASSNRVFVAGNARDYDFKQQFDVIIMVGVLHHMDKPLETLQHLITTLAPGGTLLVNEPQGSNPVIRWARAMRMRINKEYSDEQEEYSAGQLSSLMEKAGFARVSITAQGLFSTPFAEVIMPLQPIAKTLSKFASAADTVLERTAQPLLKHLSWNLIAAGTKPVLGAHNPPNVGQTEAGVFR
jgi:SAM-dependent methyltransferase